MENNNYDNLQVNRVIVQDKNGVIISSTWANRALKLVARGKAIIVSEEPLTIQLVKDVTSNNKQMQLDSVVGEQHDK